MNMRLVISFLLTSAFMLTGCATMSGDECMTSDWHTIGYEDGVKGYSSDRVGNHRKACAKHGVSPDFQAYQQGRDQGLEQFCQPSRGFNLGSNGGSYNGVCSAHREGDFIDAYNSGYHLYNLRSRVNSANNQINNKRRQVEKNEELIKEKEATLIAKETSIEDRVLVLSDLKDLSEENGQLDAEIVQLIEDRAMHEHALSSYQSVLADSGF